MVTVKEDGKPAQISLYATLPIALTEYINRLEEDKEQTVVLAVIMESSSEAK